MNMSMNIHNVAEIALGDIRLNRLDSGKEFYIRSISLKDKTGHVLICIDSYSDDGYKLLVADTELAEMNAELPLLKAA